MAATLATGEGHTGADGQLPIDGVVPYETTAAERTLEAFGAAGGRSPKPVQVFDEKTGKLEGVDGDRSQAKAKCRLVGWDALVAHSEGKSVRVEDKGLSLDDRQRLKL